MPKFVWKIEYKPQENNMEEVDMTKELNELMEIHTKKIEELEKLEDYFNNSMYPYMSRLVETKEELSKVRNKLRSLKDKLQGDDEGDDE